MNNIAFKVVLTVLLVVLMAYSAYTMVRLASQAALPDSTTEIRLPPGASLDDVKLIDTSDEQYDFSKLKGKVWIGSMFFSTCPFECAALMQQVKKLAEDPALAGLQFVSVTVDPETDTPEVLAEYAEKLEADTDRWALLTGSMGDIAVFGTKILRVQTGHKTHTPRLILIDQEGKIRGAFLFKDPDEMAKLRRAAAALAGNELTDATEASEETTKPAESEDAAGEPAASSIETAEEVAE